MFREIIPFKSEEESIQKIKNRPNLSLRNASEAYIDFLPYDGNMNSAYRVVGVLS